MPPEVIVEKPHQKISNFWTVIIVLVVLLFIGLIIYFTREKGETLTDEEIQAFNESATATGPSTLSNEELESLGNSTTGNGSAGLSQEEIENFKKSATVPQE